MIQKCSRVLRLPFAMFVASDGRCVLFLSCSLKCNKPGAANKAAVVLPNNTFNAPGTNATNTPATNIPTPQPDAIMVNASTNSALNPAGNTTLNAPNMGPLEPALPEAVNQTASSANTSLQDANSVVVPTAQLSGESHDNSHANNRFGVAWAGAWS